MCVRGPLLTAYVLAACAGEPQATVEIAPLTRAQLIDVEVESECRRLEAGADVGRIDEFRDAALAKLGRTRMDRSLSLERHGDDATVGTEIATRVAQCRKQAGWVHAPGPDGNPTWVRTGR